MLMASCSKNVEPSPSDPDAWQTDLNLPVPVEFGSPDVSTKAGFIEDLVQDADSPFGVFAINCESDFLDNSDNYLFNNRTGYLKNGVIELEKLTYYPMVSDKRYNFYAYYTKSTKPVIQSEDKVYIQTEVGATDILYGRTVAQTITLDDKNYEGFNAAYIRAARKTPTPEDFYPNIMFKHATAGVQFYVKTPQDKADYFNENTMWVQEISLNVPTTGKLCVIDKVTLTNPEATNMEGQFATPNDEDIKKLKVASGPLYPTWEQSYDDINSGVIGRKAGNPCFLIPTDKTISGNILMQRIEGTTTVNVPVSFELKYNLKAGYRYNIALLIHSPELVTFEVDVEEWKDGFKEGDVVYDDNNPGSDVIEIG